MSTANKVQEQIKTYGATETNRGCSGRMKHNYIPLPNSSHRAKRIHKFGILFDIVRIWAVAAGFQIIVTIWYILKIRRIFCHYSLFWLFGYFFHYSIFSRILRTIQPKSEHQIIKQPLILLKNLFIFTTNLHIQYLKSISDKSWWTKKFFSAFVLSKRLRVSSWIYLLLKIGPHYTHFY